MRLSLGAGSGMRKWPGPFPLLRMRSIQMLVNDYEAHSGTGHFVPHPLAGVLRAIEMSRQPSSSASGATSHCSLRDGS